MPVIEVAAFDVQSDSFAEAAPNSLSNSSMVGRLPFNFSGRLSASRYSDMPMGLLISRSAYSATKRSRVLHRMITSGSFCWNWAKTVPKRD
jgi:hypothetical protein